MIENKPSIYNAQSIYNQGGGGGGFVVIDEVAYSTVKINGLEWTCQNFMFVGKNWGGSTTGWWYDASLQTAPHKRWLRQWGYFYTKNQVAYIINNVDLKGFRIPTKEDFETLFSVPGDDLRSVETWAAPGNNNTGLNLPPNGHWVGNSFNNNITACELWSSTIDSNSDLYEYEITNTGIQRVQIENQSYNIPIRLCK